MIKYREAFKIKRGAFAPDLNLILLLVLKFFGADWILIELDPFSCIDVRGVQKHCADMPVTRESLIRSHSNACQFLSQVRRHSALQVRVQRVESRRWQFGLQLLRLCMNTQP